MSRRGHWRAGFALAIALAFTPQELTAQIPAFSGADGPGSTATGGRAGDVYHVTNLDFDLNGATPGSLKYGITHAPAAGRTIVFDVGGTIYQNGGGAQFWFRSGTSNITIAGQTAPGGITIAGVGSKFTGNNLILRNFTVRPNQDPVNPTSFTYDGISTQATNSIIDHVSVTWFSDEGISATDAVNNTTVQYALIGEGLNYNGHSYGSIINTQNNDAPIGYHHNLYAQNNSRNPRLGSETGTGAIANFYNNVIYNWVSRAGYSAFNTDSGAPELSRTNFLSNFYLRGANNGSTIFQAADNHTQIYQSGNLFDSNKDGDFNDGAAITWTNFQGGPTQLASPLAVAGNAIDSATQARDRVLAYGGATWWNRNSIDARIFSNVATGSGAIINTVPTTEWNNVLTAPLSSRAADWDVENNGVGQTTGDGMPSWWEVAHGLNPSVDDHAGDFDADGYTNLEEYINEVAEWPAPAPIIFNAATNNRYAQITNWDVNADPTAVLNWQPSRFDEAQINAGTVAVDAVGQHAGTLKIAANNGNVAQLNITNGWLIANTSVVIGGTATAQGTLNLSGGLLTTPLLNKGAAGAFNFTGGVLSADTVNFSLVNNGGTITPDNSPGLTHIVGDLTINSGTLEIEIGGAAPGQYDKVVVDGIAQLGGTLKVTLVDLGSGQYVPQLGDQFGFLAAQGGTGGMFSILDLPNLAPGLAWAINPGNVTNFLSVIAAPTLAGDYNNDGFVDAADYTVWRDALGNNTALPNETASLGTVDQADYDTWKNNFGAGGSGSGSGSSVPEPAICILVAAVVGIGMIWSARFRKSTRLAT